jgi:hypothetical protein
MNDEFEGVVYWNLPGGTEENDDKPQSRYPVS